MDISKKKNIISILLVMVCFTSIFAAMTVHAESQPVVAINDTTISRGSTKNVGLFINDVTHLGSFDIKINWDPAIITVESVNEHDDFEVASNIDNENGYANLVAHTLGNITGSVQPAIFEIKAIGSVGESCILQIETSVLLTADPDPEEIDHIQDHGLITVGEPSSGGGGGSGSGGGGGGLPPPPANTPPVCNASLSETTGFVDEPIQFDGSESYDSDGSISSYIWDFGDGVTKTGVTVTHQYSNEGSYEVSLTITDDDGASASDTINVIIAASANTPPTSPSITGPDTGTTGAMYQFSIGSTDSDGDDLSYQIDWGDGTTTTTAFISEGSEMSVAHQYNQSGRYVITVSADDNKTVSSSSTHVILIDAMEIIMDGEMIGVICDDDKDNIYDRFNAYEDQISYQENTNQYLLDTDGDATWDYTYDVSTDQTMVYQEVDEKQDTTDMSWLLIIGAIIVLVIIGVIIYMIQLKQQKK